MTHAFLAENHRRRTRMTLPVWKHECCGGVHWSAARQCDRCGTAATATISNLSIAEAMAERSLPPLTLLRPPAQNALTTPAPPADVAAPPAAAVSIPPVDAKRPAVMAVVRRQPEEMDRLFLVILWWLAGVVSVVLGIGAIVEFSDANYVYSVILAVAASSTPAGVLCAALDGWLQRLAIRRFRRA